MPSTYSPRLRLELQATGENRSTWGTKANNVFRRIEDSIAGYTTIAASDANYVLTTANGSEDEAREAIINITGTWTAARTVTIPDVEKMYVMRNATTGGFAMTIANSSNSISVANGEIALVITDGVNIQRWGNNEDLPLSGGTLSGILNMGSNKITNLANGTSSADAVNFGQLSSAVPSGAFFPFAGSTLPSGYLWCAGQAISRTTYANLFAAIGTEWGSGNGSTTFNVPDFRGRVPAGKDNMGGSAAGRLTSQIDGDNLGSYGGAETVTLTSAHIPSHSFTVSGTTGGGGAHSHTFSGTTNTTGSHTHVYARYDPGNSAGGTGGARCQTPSTNNYSTSSAGNHSHTVSGSTSSVSNHTHSFSGTTNSYGGGGPHSNLQPTGIANYIIKT